MSAEELGSGDVVIALPEARTVDGKVSESSTCSPLNFSVVAAQEEEDWVESFTTHGPDLFLSDFCERKSGTSLKVNIVGK